MKNFGKQIFSVKEYLTLALAVIFSLVLLYSNENKQVFVIQRWFIEISGSLLEKLSFFEKIISIYEENIELKRQNAQLKLEATKYHEALLENIRLRKLVEFRQKNEFQVVAAAVISTGATLFTSTLVLDAGRSRGVAPNMPVVTAEGLAGKIINVAENYSIAHILLDRNFRVSATLQRTRLKGIVRWERGNLYRMDGIVKRADVRTGDIIVTSGYSTIFPPGLKIGEVVDCQDNINQLFKDVLVTPSVDFSKLEEVFILKEVKLDSIR
ncbi:rod shape-determining protein MreC [candidate division KSB1 bacterium]|nr:rod shape-determining protein MreC [candidate division KSB1 bacterium]